MKDETFFVKAKCVTNKKDFFIRYDFAADKCWCITYGVTSIPKNTSISSPSKIDTANARTGPQYKCLHCGNTSFVRCGSCHKITCYPGGKHFKCVYCGNSGEVSGTIESIDGSFGDGQ